MHYGDDWSTDTLLICVSGAAIAQITYTGISRSPRLGTEVRVHGQLV